jgi:LacI family transcriptional regulator
VPVANQRKVTLSEVAARAGVSVTTASYIMNGRSAEMRIAAETQQRVKDAVAELGYRPNRMARSLRTRRTATFGLISDYLAFGNFSSQMLAGASAAAREVDHLVVMGETGGDPDLESLLIDEMLDRQVDGVVFATLAATRITVNPRLAGVRTVLLNCVDLASGTPAVLPDDLEGGRVAASVLLEAGFRDGIFVIGHDPNPEAVAGPLRLVGIEQRLNEAGVELSGVVPCNWDVRPAFEAVDSWLAGGVRPRALICLNDRIAMGVYQAMAAHGLRLPEDVSVVSFDGSEIASWLRPPLTSVALPFHDLGRRAVELLMDPELAPDPLVHLPMPVQRGGSVLNRF